LVNATVSALFPVNVQLASVLLNMQCSLLLHSLTVDNAVVCK